jgi:hypothetical protein
VVVGAGLVQAVRQARLVDKFGDDIVHVVADEPEVPRHTLGQTPVRLAIVVTSKPIRLMEAGGVVLECYPDGAGCARVSD